MPLTPKNKMKQVIYNIKEGHAELLHSEGMDYHEVMEELVNALKDATRFFADQEKLAPIEAWGLVVDFINRVNKEYDWKVEKSNKNNFEFVINKK